ncbi:FdhF/YdeP family oxidoreductase [Teichococcus aestuarii]|uniref:FdhF/YdeP family oxidoreductase n=2 Tax=Teichococcus aestuarii TaxID=568898 RepID=UPI0036157769
MSQKAVKIEPYKGPAGGWGSAQSLLNAVRRDGAAQDVLRLLPQQNKKDGFACVSCAWAKPASPHPFEFCENGAKATTWELTSRRATPEFFARHTVSELRLWNDHDLEYSGRLTQPLRYDRETDRYVAVAWEEAFRAIGAELRQLRPETVVFYASGRASLETSYMYQLFARLYGSNHLPDSSNMCHETTSVALPQSIGVPVGTVLLEDFDHTDCILSFGQNTGTNSPRMLHPLQKAAKRNVPIIIFNPLRERGLERFVNPQNPIEMAGNAFAGSDTRLDSQYHQLKAGGDGAAIMGLCKAVIAADDKARAAGRAPVVDHAFIAEHTQGFESFAESVRAMEWSLIEQRSGLSRTALEGAANVYCNARAVIAKFGMGLTQHRDGVETVRLLINLLLLRGNIGRRGAGILPVRGHSNVQGQRTVGISEKPELVPLDRLAEQYHFEPPRWEGWSTVDACQAVIDGEAKGFIGLGGNFARAVPDTERVESAWTGLRLTVHVATKLNRSHLLPGEVCYLLPCLGRLEVDHQASGPQAVSIEDSTACIHGSRGKREPASPDLLSEPRIVAEMAKAALPSNPHVDWDGWVGDYGRVRDAIEATYPQYFERFNERLFQPGGFPRPLGARDRKWATKSGKAEFLTPTTVSKAQVAVPEGVLQLITLRSNDQFNTTIYGYHDRFRGVQGTRMILFMNRADMRRQGFQEGELVSLQCAIEDGIMRRLGGFRVTPYAVPEGCCAAYYPECNPLIPLSHHAEGSKVPAAKSVPVVIDRQAAPRPFGAI